MNLQIYIEGNHKTGWFVSTSKKKYWLKPFDTLRDALAFARSLGGCVWQCKN